jgi:hypothetical protein
MLFQMHWSFQIVTHQGNLNVFHLKAGQDNLVIHQVVGFLASTSSLPDGTQAAFSQGAELARFLPLTTSHPDGTEAALSQGAEERPGNLPLRCHREILD